MNNSEAGVRGNFDSQGVTVGTDKIRKFQDLISASKELDDVIDHLNALCISIGFNEGDVCESCDPNKEPEATLISTLNTLPTKIRGKIKTIHDKINKIESELN